MTIAPGLVPDAPPAAPVVDVAPDPVRVSRAFTDVVARRAVACAVPALTAALFAATFVTVQRYYVDHLPHYDSIGSYGFMFGVVNVTRTQGIGSAIVMASEWPTTWLHGFYALLVAWLPGARSPEVLVSLNFLLLLLAQASIVVCVREYGYGRLRQVVAALLSVVPGVAYVWDGGIQDLRRDPQLVLLLTASLFLSIAYVRRPSWQKGLALGVAVGLAQWSRDNAAAMLALAAVPAAVLAVARHVRRGRWVDLMRLAALPVAVFLAIAGPYYALTLSQTIQRYRGVVWGVGEDRVASLLAFGDAPLAVLLGGDGRDGGTPGVAWITLALLVSQAAILGLLVALGVARIVPNRLRGGGGLTLTLSGLYMMAAVILYTTLGLGYGARWHAMPFLTVSVGVVAVLTGLLATVEPGPLARRQYPFAVAAVVAGAVMLAGAATWRMAASEPPPVGMTEVEAVRAASLRLGEITTNRAIALLWRSGFSRHHATFYLTQAGRGPLPSYEGRSALYGMPIDFDQPLRVADDPAVLRRTLDVSIRKYADFVLVCEDTARYEDPAELLWPFRLGRPVVDGFLADPTFVPVTRFSLSGVPFVLLENTRSMQ